MHEIANRMESKGIRHRIAALQNNTTAQICVYVQSWEDDMVAISTQGWSGMRRFVLGCVADMIISTSKSPVLVVYPPIESHIT